MLAAVLRAEGEAPVIGEFREPELSNSEVTGSVIVAGLNPVDLMPDPNRHGWPRVAGREGIAGLASGERVYFDKPAMPFGSLAERVPIDLTQAFPVPDGLDAAVAVALGVAGLAAWLPLTWRAQLKPGERVLVVGATGIVGQIAVQSAKLLGASLVVAAGRDRGTLERISELGADACIPIDATFGQKLRDATPEGFDVVIDTLYGTPLEAALGSAARDARIVAVGLNAGDIIAVPFQQLLNRTMIGHTNVGTPLDVRREAFSIMAKHALAGTLRVAVARFPLADVSTAWDQQAAGPHRKLVVIPGSVDL